jgi:hypothetical protein
MPVIQLTADEERRAARVILLRPEPATFHRKAVILYELSRRAEVTITGRFDQPPPSHPIPIPWTRDGAGSTGLNKPCVAGCIWLREVDQHNVFKSVGYLPADRVQRIVDAFDRLYEDDSFTDWI